LYEKTIKAAVCGLNNNLSALIGACSGRGAESFRLLGRGNGLLPGRDLTVNPAYSAGGSFILKSDGKKKD